MANPVGGVAPGRAKAREPYQNFDEGRSLPGVNYIPLPMIGEGLGEWFEAPSYEEGVGVDGGPAGLPCIKSSDDSSGDLVPIAHILCQGDRSWHKGRC